MCVCGGGVGAERRLEGRRGKREERERRRKGRRRGEKAVSLPFYKCGRKRTRKIKIKTCLNAPPIENSEESVSQVQIAPSPWVKGGTGAELLV